MNDEEKNICVKFLTTLKSRGKSYARFEESLNRLQKYVASQGLEDEDIHLLGSVIIDTDLNATKLVKLINCLIPKYKMPEKTFYLITTWYLSSVNELPITVSIAVTQWIVGLWNHQIVDRKVVNVYYSVFYYVMIKKEKLSRYIARLIYVLTRPDDVTRRDVSRLLSLRQKYSKPQGYITALLSLFKTYKPELVPEKIQSVNIESVWKPIPEVLQTMLQTVRDRLENQEKENVDFKSFDWNIFERVRGKKTIPLVPSIGYFQIGSSIFKAKDTKSIFDISSIDEFGTSHSNIELPCNAISLLSNTAGYHLLTFSDFHYQRRFSYNLYNTLTRAFILESEKFSEEEIDKLLEMTAEFSRYMQQGIPVVNRFLDEYLYFNTGEYRSKLLALLQWMTSTSISDLQDKILVHLQNMYYESSITEKCEIIRTLKMLITNLFVNEGFEESDQETAAPFLGQISMGNLEDVVLILTKFIQDLIASGLNIHSYHILLLSEALLFYDQICTLESRSDIQSFTVAPPAVIYGGFVTRSCAILSMTCNLLLRYRNMSLQFMKHKPEETLLDKRIEILSVYVKDICNALLSDELFTKEHGKYFLKNIPDEVLRDLEHYNLDNHLNILHHYAILPYKYTLSKTGLNISTKEVRNYFYLSILLTMYFLTLNVKFQTLSTSK
ncbi:centromere protein I-like isoform X2 [Hylaeus volcanicus]|uniref:centromere protein I-like isoform X2 n=1 Tax=Hylaeus volcanicus TaxID=313075 RepID=UPI0023B7E871|nr:centromere protein I-like isoform X2 [Hylaeus volcanicus]